MNLEEIFSDSSPSRKKKPIQRPFPYEDNNDLPNELYSEYFIEENRPTVRRRKNSKKDIDHLTGGFKQLIIINEIPTDYPDPPYDPEEEAVEKNMKEEAKRYRENKKKVKLSGDPFKHRNTIQSQRTMNLMDMNNTLPLEYNFQFHSQ